MRNTRLAVCTACAVFLTTAVPALAWGTARDDHVVAGCDERRTGSVRVLEGDERTSRDTTRISWNRSGAEVGPGSFDPVGPAGNAGATGREVVPEEIRDRSADGTSGPAHAGEIGAEGWQDEHGIADELDENGPEGDHGADGDDCALGAAGPFVARTAPRGGNGAPTAHVDSGHARAPPASLSAPRTGPGA